MKFLNKTLCPGGSNLRGRPLKQGQQKPQDRSLEGTWADFFFLILCFKYILICLINNWPSSIVLFSDFAHSELLKNLCFGVRGFFFTLMALLATSLDFFKT